MVIKKIKFELLVVTEINTKRKSRKPPDFWKHFIFTEWHRLFTIAAIGFVYIFIVYSDNLIKRIFEWLIDFLKDIN